MLKILSEMCSSGKRISIYTNMQDTNKFHYGTIVAVNAEEIAIKMISPNGNYDGVIVMSTDLVYRIEVDSKYDIKMKKLCPKFESDFYRENIDPIHIKESLLSIALKAKKIVSLELIESGYNDVVGFIEEINDKYCKIKEVDEYGGEYGFSIIMIKDITKICYDSEEEAIMLKLWAEK